MKATTSVDDVYDAEDAYYAAHPEEIEKLPRCSVCGLRIGDSEPMVSAEDGRDHAHLECTEAAHV